MLSLQLTVAAAGRRLLLLSQESQTPVTSTIIPNSSYLALLLDGETFSSTADSRVFIDSSQNNFTITNANNTVVQTSFSPYGEVGYWSAYNAPGASGLGLGVGGAVGLSAFNFMHNTTAKFTFECWILRTTNATSQTLFDNRAGVATRIGVSILLVSNKLRLSIGNGSVAFCTADSISTVSTKWTHIAITYDHSLASGNAKIYIDGVLDSATDKVAGTPSSSNAFGSTSIAGSGFSGFMSNLRISNDILYSSNFTPATTPLTASSSTQFLIAQNSFLIDNSANGYSLVKGGGTAIVRFSPFGVPQQTTASVGSAYFDVDVTKRLLVPSDQAFVFGTGDFTIEAWLYPGQKVNGGSDPRDRAIFGGLFSPATGTSCILCLEDNTNKLSLYHRDGARYSGQLRINSSAAVDEQVWSHVACVRNSGNVTLFINGKASGTFTNYNVDFSYQGQMAIGKDETTTNPSRAFSGYISDLRVFKGAAIYTSNFAPPINPLSAITGTSLLMKFNNWSISDKINSHLATYLQSTSTTATGISSVVTKNGTSSLYFNGGTNDYIRVRRSVPGGAQNTIDFARADFTIEFWINFSSFGASRIIYAYDSTTAANNPLMISTNAAATSATVSITSNGSTFDIANGVVLSAGATTGTWRHMALTRSGDTFRTFSNGTLVSTFTSTSTLLAISNRDLTIGGRAGVTNINGYIDDFRVYQGFAKYTADFTPE